VSHWDVGYALFKDKETFKAHFIEADILNSPALDELKGKVDIISISAVLHQWSWEDQVEAAKKLVAYSKVGSLVVGHQIGNIEAKSVVNPHFGVTQYQHDPTSFGKLWDEVGVATGPMWETKARSLMFEDVGWNLEDVRDSFMNSNAKVIDFVVTRKS
jgi:hypothetical protein